MGEEGEKENVNSIPNSKTSLLLLELRLNVSRLWKFEHVIEFFLVHAPFSRMSPNNYGYFIFYQTSVWNEGEGDGVEGNEWTDDIWAACS